MVIDGDENEVVEGTEPDSGTNGEVAEGQDDGVGEGDDEPEGSTEHVDDAEDDGESEDVAPRRSRAETRFQKLANEAKEAKTKAEAAEAEVRAMRVAQAQQNQHLTQQQEAERLALMTPEERADYKISRFERDAHIRAQNQELRTQALVDKASYDAKATINPVYAKYKDEVDAQFEERMKAGRPVEREVILKFMLGERALNGALSSTRKAKAQGQRRIDAQRTSSGNSKGDRSAERQKAGNTAESRLKDVYI